MAAAENDNVAQGLVAAAAARSQIADFQHADKWKDTADIVSRAGLAAQNAAAARATVVERARLGRTAVVGGTHRQGGGSEARAASVDTRCRPATGGAFEGCLGAAHGVAAGAQATKLVA